MDILGQSALFVAVIGFGLSFSILARDPRNKLFIAYSILSSIISLWAFFFFLEIAVGGGSFYRIHLFFHVWTAPASIAFLRIFLKLEADAFNRRLLNLAIFVALGFTVAMALNLDVLPPVLNSIYATRLLVVLQILRFIARPPERPQANLSPPRRRSVYWASLWILVISTMDQVPVVPRAIPAVGNLLVSLGLFLVSQAITHQRLLNVGALVSRLLVLLGVALMLTVIYSALVAWIQDSPGLFFLNSFIVSFLLLTLLDPLRSLVRYATERLLTQQHRRVEQLLADSRRKLAGIVDPGSLLSAISATVEQLLAPRWSAIFLLKADGTKYRRVRSVGSEPEPEGGLLRELLADHPLLQYCERSHRRGDLPVVLDQVIENEIDRSASRTQREHLASHVQALRSLGGNLLLPLVDAGKILGFVVTDVPNPPEPWGNNWGLLQVVYPYFEQAARSMRSMEVYSRQREKERLAAIGEMAAGLAHEIRNPLGAIKGAAQYLDPSADRPESRFLRVIVEEVDRLNRVVTQFLDYSKPQTAEKHPVELNEIAEKAVALLSPTLPPETRVKLEKHARHARVLGAPEQLHQVLLNLLQNSIKAVQGKADGLVRISVDIEGTPEGRFAVIEVEDNGKGIKREILDKIFIPFFTTSPSGTGLGLPICQKIVENHRGRLEVATEEGRFARFSVIIPLLEGE